MKRTVASLFSGIALLFLLATAAFAHAKLVKSEPAADSTVTVAPKVVTIWFNEELDTKKSYIKVTRQAGNVQVDLGDSKVNLDDRKQISVGLQAPLANGVYFVRWHAVTPDDDGVTEAEFRFTLNAPVQATAVPVPAGTVTAAASSATPILSTATPVPATSTPVPPVPTRTPSQLPAPAPAAGGVDPAALLIGASVVVLGAGAFLLLRHK